MDYVLICQTLKLYEQKLSLRNWGCEVFFLGLLTPYCGNNSCEKPVLPSLKIQIPAVYIELWSSMLNSEIEKWKIQNLIYNQANHKIPTNQLRNNKNLITNIKVETFKSQKNNLNYDSNPRIFNLKPGPQYNWIIKFLPRGLGFIELNYHFYLTAHPAIFLYRRSNIQSYKAKSDLISDYLTNCEFH